VFLGISGCVGRSVQPKAAEELMSLGNLLLIAAYLAAAGFCFWAMSRVLF
jgi:hypothetical protein